LRTLYDVLGVAADASRDELHRAYLRRARELHPDNTLDASPGEIEVRTAAMAELNEAWRVLGNQQARRSYDRRRGITPTGLRPTPTTSGATDRRGMARSGQAPPRPRPRPNPGAGNAGRGTWTRRDPGAGRPSRPPDLGVTGAGVARATSADGRPRTPDPRVLRTRTARGKSTERRPRTPDPRVLRTPAARGKATAGRPRASRPPSGPVVNGSRTSRTERMSLIISCRHCGCVPAVPVRLRGRFEDPLSTLLGRSRTESGPLCRSCGTALFRHFTDEVFLTAGNALGLVGLVVYGWLLAVVRAGGNVRFWFRIHTLSTPRPLALEVPHPGTPFDPGPSLWRRRGPARMARLLAAAVVIACLAIAWSHFGALKRM
jgi:hypothetical protein